MHWPETDPWPSPPLIPHSLEIRLEHHRDELLERGRGLPAELGLHIRGVPTESWNLGSASELRIAPSVLSPVEPRMREGDLAELLDGNSAARRYHILSRVVGLEHQPHHANIVTRKTPVPLGMQVPHPEVLGHPVLDPCDPIRDLPAHELDAAYRRLVVEQDAGAREHPVTLAVVERRPPRTEPAHAIPAAPGGRGSLRRHRLGA